MTRLRLAAFVTGLYFLAGFAATALAASLDNKGVEFIVSFLPPFSGPTTELHLTADAPTMVTVEYPVNAPSFTTTVPVNPGAITIVGLPTSASTGWPVSGVANNSVRLVGDQEFVAYMISRETFTSDAALALPVDTMNTEYIVSTYNEAFLQAEFIVTAAFDDTAVTITPSNATAGGNPAGVPFGVTLNRGEGVIVRGAQTGVNGGLAGSIVTADKPVGLSNGNGCTQVPIGVTACDHIFEIAQPTQTWGSEILVVNLPNRPSGSIYRILASQNDTTVAQDGVDIGTIDRGQFIEIGPLPGAHVFSADKAIFVSQFMTGVSSPGAVSGDPAMGNMVPPAQFLRNYTFSTVGAGQFVLHFLTIIAHNDNLDTLLLDGAAVGAGAFSPIPGTAFSSAVLPLAEGTHVTSSPSPHGITVEGYNEADSYLYPGGALFEFINPVGDDNPPICEGHLVMGPPQSFEGTVRDDRPTEDANGNGELDAGEDLNGNGQIDQDSGIFFVALAPGAFNLSLSTDAFIPGTKAPVAFAVSASDPNFLGAGTLVATDGSGLTCELPVELGDFDPFGGLTVTPSRSVRLTLRRPSPDTTGVRCVETMPPDPPDFDGVPFTEFDGDEVEIDVELSEGDGEKTVCCQFRNQQQELSPPICDSITVQTMPAGESECTDFQDNDSDGRIDCEDPDCTECGPILKVCQGSGCPNKILFGAVQDKLELHGRVMLPPGLDIQNAAFGLLLTNANGVVLSQMLAPASLASIPRRFQFRNPVARRLGGFSRVTLKQLRDGTWRLDAIAHGDLATAILGEMTLQARIGQKQFVTTDMWTERSWGWIMRLPENR